MVSVRRGTDDFGRLIVAGFMISGSGASGPFAPSSLRLIFSMTLLLRARRFATASLREIVERFSAVRLRLLPGEVRLFIDPGGSVEVIASKDQDI